MRGILTKEETIAIIQSFFEIKHNIHFKGRDVVWDMGEHGISFCIAQGEEQKEADNILAFSMQ